MYITKSEHLRIGYIHLLDAAPFIMAGELGLYKKYGLKVSLVRELGWASIENKMVQGELDAAHALAVTPLALTAGLGVFHRPFRAPMAISYLGNGITLSSRIRERGVRSIEEFRSDLRSRRWEKKYTLGVVARLSTHRYLLDKWLRSQSIDPEKDVNIVVVPPGQALRNLRAGTLDGYCVGEPWNSLAEQEGVGWIVAWSQDIAPNHPEKVLMLSEDFTEKNPNLCTDLAAALLEACEFCEDPSNSQCLCETLSKNAYFGAMTDHLPCWFKQYRRCDSTGKEPCALRFRSHSDRNHLTQADMDWIADVACLGNESDVPEKQIFESLHRIYRPLTAQV